MSNALPDFEAWAMFALVADRGGLSAAARDLQCSRATVSKALARLEARLGTALFQRHSRVLALTPAGEAALEAARALLESGETLESGVREAAQALVGRIRMAAPMDFGAEWLAPILPPFLAAHPGIRLELVLDDARADLVAGGFDLALRIGALADSSLLARRLCHVPRHLVAAPSYLAAAGVPAHPRDLSRHRLLIYANLPNPLSLRFARATGEEAIVAVDGPLRVNNGRALMPALYAGLGLALQPEFLLGDALRTGALVPVLPDWAAPPLSLFLLSPPGRRPLRVRLLMDWLVEALGRPRATVLAGGASDPPASP
jgi:DNA-binding transcriptional LysR family regulator